MAQLASACTLFIPIFLCQVVTEMDGDGNTNRGRPGRRATRVIQQYPTLCLRHCTELPRTLLYAHGVVCFLFIIPSEAEVQTQSTTAEAKKVDRRKVIPFRL
jgi:hypothetical protein